MTQIPQAIAWTLIHFCWQAAAIAADYRVVSIAIARRSSQTRYFVALSALLLMLCSARRAHLRSRCAPTLPQSLSPTPLRIFAPPSSTNSRAFRCARCCQPHPPSHRTPHVALAMLPWIDGLWLIGVFALSVRSLGGWWYLRRLRLGLDNRSSAAVRASFQRISTRSACTARSRFASPTPSIAR